MMPVGRPRVNRAAGASAERTTAVAAMPRPRSMSGSDGLSCHGCILPPGALVIAAPPPRSPVGRSGRESYREPRARKLSAEQADAIRADGGGRSLRDLAGEFGVSHETVRSVLRATGCEAPG